MPGTVRVGRPCAAPAGRRDRRRARRRRALAPRRAGRRHDGARASCSGSSTRARSTGSRRGCPHGSALVSATNGKTTTAAMAAEILGRGSRLAHNRSGREPRLRRRLRPSLDAARRRARALRGGRGRAARGRAGASGRGRSASATSSATSSTATASSSSSPSAGARRSRTLAGGHGARRERRRPAGRRARAATARGALVFGVDDPRARAAVAPARGRLEVLRPLRDAVRVRGRLRRAPRRLPLPALRPRAAAARRRRARDRARTGSTASRSSSSTPRGDAARAAPRCRGSTTSTTRSPPRRSRSALGASLDEVAARARALQRRVRPLRADRGRRPRACSCC